MCDSVFVEYEIDTTNIFDKWLTEVKDTQHRARIISRFDYIQLGNFGDHKNLGGNLFELRFFLALASGLITPSRVERSFFCFAAATSPPKAKTSKKQEALWTNWSK